VAHPFSRLSRRAQRHALVILGVLTFALTTFLAVLGSPLQTPAAPSGIVSLELAGSAAAAREILDSWSPYQRDLARLGLWIDFLYLVSYPLFLALACARLADRVAGRAPRWARAGEVLAWALPLAGLLDAVENSALLRVLGSGASDAAAGLARACALPKFALVLAALAYLALGLGWMWRTRPGRR